MYCSNCGSKVEGRFCPNCGKEVTQNGVFQQENNGQISPELNAYFKQKLDSKKNHDVYRIVVGIVMIILGFCITIAGLSEDYTLEYILLGYNLTLAFVLPGIFILAGGILSIVSKKVNILLLISGILYLAAAICNLCGISNISLLFILSCIFGPLNIVFYSKAQK